MQETVRWKIGVDTTEKQPINHSDIGMNFPIFATILL